MKSHDNVHACMAISAVYMKFHKPGEHYQSSEMCSFCLLCSVMIRSVSLSVGESDFYYS